MARIWGMLKNRDRILQDTVATFDGNDLPELQEAVDRLCHQLDIPRPMILSKHEREYASFARTRFLADDFVESIHFHHFELEFLKEKNKQRRT